MHPRKTAPTTRNGSSRSSATTHSSTWTKGQTLNQQGKRQGNIVLPTIRSAWNGETLGQSNAQEETTRHVPAGSYSLGMVIGYQKDTAQEMLGDVHPERRSGSSCARPQTRRCR